MVQSNSSCFVGLFWVLGFLLLQRIRDMAEFKFFGLLLCWVGIHDFRVVEVTLGFGDAGNVEKVRCNRGTVIVLR